MYRRKWVKNINEFNFQHLRHSTLFFIELVPGTNINIFIRSKTFLESKEKKTWLRRPSINIVVVVVIVVDVDVDADVSDWRNEAAQKFRFISTTANVPDAASVGWAISRKVAKCKVRKEIKTNVDGTASIEIEEG